MKNIEWWSFYKGAVTGFALGMIVFGSLMISKQKQNNNLKFENIKLTINSK